jgi:hypothetical protein
MFATTTATFSCVPQDAASKQLFEREFDRTSFEFAHTMHQSESFSFPAILDLARRVSARPNRYYIEENDTTPGKGWGTGALRKPLPQYIEDIAGEHTLVMLKRVHEEPEYREILDQCVSELSDATGTDIRRRYRDPLMTILITSPRRVTPYHIDAEANLLLQMHGSKLVYIFDGKDREVQPAEELERYWTGDIKAPTYKQDLQNRATEYKLTPGVGVANPVTFPHWVQNGDEVSISASINFKRMTDNEADAHRINMRLRKLGLHPTEPGKAPVIDHAKGALYRAFRGAKHKIDSKKQPA